MSKKVTANLENSVSQGPSAPENDYESQGHLRTLIEAHGIMNDPVKMAKVHKLAGRHHKAIKGIQDIKDRYNEMVKPKSPMATLAGTKPEPDTDGE